MSELDAAALQEWIRAVRPITEAVVPADRLARLRASFDQLYAELIAADLTPQLVGASIALGMVKEGLAVETALALLVVMLPV